MTTTKLSDMMHATIFGAIATRLDRVNVVKPTCQPVATGLISASRLYSAGMMTVAMLPTSAQIATSGEYVSSTYIVDVALIFSYTSDGCTPCLRVSFSSEPVFFAYRPPLIRLIAFFL